MTRPSDQTARGERVHPGQLPNDDPRKRAWRAKIATAVRRCAAKPCDRCDRSFRPTGGGALYCPTCQPIAFHEQRERMNTRRRQTRSAA